MARGYVVGIPVCLSLSVCVCDCCCCGAGDAAAMMVVLVLAVVVSPPPLSNRATRSNSNMLFDSVLARPYYACKPETHRLAMPATHTDDAC